MKQKFLDFCLNLIHQTHPEYSGTEMDELRYGLEGFYLTITKMIVIMGLAIFLNCLKETLLLLLLFNILRTTGFGLHASKTWICLLSSSFTFLLGPFVARILTVPFYMKLILGISGILLTYAYAPADTEKRPLIKKKKRDLYKFITTVSCIVLVSLMLFTKNELISNLILIAIYIEISFIHPWTYKLFHFQYNNYRYYHSPSSLEQN